MLGESMAGTNLSVTISRVWCVSVGGESIAGTQLHVESFAMIARACGKGRVHGRRREFGGCGLPTGQQCANIVIMKGTTIYLRCV